MTTGIWEHAVPRISFARLTARIPRPGRRALLGAAASLSVAAGVAHAAAVPSHLAEWSAAGLFFVLVAAAQCAYAVGLLRDPPRAYLGLGAAGTVGILALYAASRSVGIPVGPHAWQAEPVGALDLFCGGVELALVLALLRLRAGEPAPERAPLTRRARVVAAAALTAVLAGATASAAPVAGDHAEAAEHTEAIGEPHPSGPSADDHTAALPEHPKRRRAHERSTEHDEPPACTLPSGSPATITPSDGTAALTYARANEVFVYDVAADTATRIVEGTEGCWIHSAAFRSPTQVTFGMDDGLYEVDLTTGSIERFLESRRSITAFDWSPDGTTLAYSHWTDDDSRLTLSLVEPDGAAREIWSVAGELMDMCGGDGMFVVRWAPDGRSLLVHDAAFNAKGTKASVFVVTAEGILLQEVEGWSPRWSPAGSFLVHSRDADDETNVWYEMDVASGDRSDLGLPDGAYDALPSPDGSKISFVRYDDEGGRELRVRDTTNGATVTIAPEADNAVWLDARTLAASDQAECEACEWGYGDVAAFAYPLDGGDRRALATPTTNADPLIVEPDTDAEPLPEPVPEQGAPVFEPRDDVTTTPMSEVRFDVAAADPDGSAVSIEVADLPAGAAFDAETATFTWMPQVGQEGTYVVRFVATDADGATAEQRITITVEPFPETMACELLGACVSPLPQPPGSPEAPPQAPKGPARR